MRIASSRGVSKKAAARAAIIAADRGEDYASLAEKLSAVRAAAITKDQVQSWIEKGIPADLVASFAAIFDIESEDLLQGKIRDPRFVDFGERLKAIREAAGWTQAELAAAIGKSYQAYSHYETGMHMPDIFVLKDIAKALRCSVGYILGEEAQSVKDDRDLAMIFKELKPEERAQVLKYIRSMIIQ